MVGVAAREAGGAVLNGAKQSLVKSLIRNVVMRRTVADDVEVHVDGGHGGPRGARRVEEVDARLQHRFRSLQSQTVVSSSSVALNTFFNI